MEKFIFKNVLWTLFIITIVNANAENSTDEIRALAKQVEELKTLHSSEVQILKNEIADLKQKMVNTTTPAIKKHAHAIKILQADMKFVKGRVNNTIIKNQIQSMKRDVDQASLLSNQATERARKVLVKTNDIDGQINGLSENFEDLSDKLTDVREQYKALAKEVKEIQVPIWKENQSENEVDLDSTETRRIRHSKAMHHQIKKLNKLQAILDQNQISLRYQVLDTIKRVEKIEKLDCDGLSNQMTFAELRIEMIQHYFTNVSRRMLDMDKIHRSLLELREDVEGIENKADKTIPEFRSEMSKLDLNLAQANAQVSYLREGQENLRQSVKAIAVSVSNTMDRAEADRQVIKYLNETIGDLQNKSKQHFHRLNDHILKAETNYATSNNPTEEIPLPILMDEVKELEPVDQEYKELVNKLPHDCSTISGPPGTYLIHPGHSPINTWCNNGSTLIQRRYNGSIEFNRKFNEYVNGFGNPASEYWLGLEAMHLLTSDNCSSMRIDMVDIYGTAWYAEYDSFYVGSSDTGYVLEVGGFHGNASDAFEYQNHMEFSAIDHDRDISNTNCAANYEGGWWFSHCQHVNINGKYNLGLTWFDSGKNEWIAVATSDMRMYRKC